MLQEDTHARTHTRFIYKYINHYFSQFFHDGLRFVQAFFYRRIENQVLVCEAMDAQVVSKIF